MRNKGSGDAGSGTAASPLRVGGILAAIILAAVVVFSLGVMVGKRVAESTAPFAAPPAALPTEHLVPVPLAPAVPAPGSGGEPEEAGTGKAPPSEELTFYDTLAGKEISGAPPLRKAAAPPGKDLSGVTGAEAAEQIKALLGGGRYQVQISSSTRRSWADDLVSRLGRNGLQAVSSPTTVNGRKYYRIRVGPFPDLKAARRAAELFKKGMKLDAMVVRNG